MSNSCKGLIGRCLGHKFVSYRVKAAISLSELGLGWGCADIDLPYDIFRDHYIIICKRCGMKLSG